MNDISKIGKQNYTLYFSGFVTQPSLDTSALSYYINRRVDL